MISKSLFRSLSVALSALVITSCSDSNPMAPGSSATFQSAQATLKDNGSGLDLAHLELKALWWEKHQKDVRAVSKNIGPEGGTIQLPATGFTMVVPPGALKKSITITVTPDDKYVAYTMEPTGTQFQKDVSVTQLLSFSTIGGSPLRTQIFAAYIADDRLKLSGNLKVLEILPSSTILSAVTGLPQAQSWVIRHFSRYMLASG